MTRILMGLVLVGLLSASDAMAERIDLNSASQEDLETLPGVGPKVAQDIIDNRPYTVLEDLLKLPRFGKKRLEQIRPLVSIDGVDVPAEAPAPADTPKSRKSKEEAPEATNSDWAPPEGMKKVVCWRCQEHFCVETATSEGVCPYCSVRWKQGGAQ